MRDAKSRHPTINIPDGMCPVIARHARTTDPGSRTTDPDTRPRLQQPGTVHAQPVLAVAEVRAHSFHFLPESARMILFPQMHQLVKNHVVADGRRHLNQAIVQRDPSGPRAGTPSRPLISNRERRHNQLVSSSKLEQPFAQFSSRNVAQVRFNARSNGSLCSRNANRTITVLDPEVTIVGGSSYT